MLDTDDQTDDKATCRLSYLKTFLKFLKFGHLQNYFSVTLNEINSTEFIQKRVLSPLLSVSMVNNVHRRNNLTSFCRCAS